MAMPAWSAKVVTRSILLVSEGANGLAHQDDSADRMVFAQQRYGEDRAKSDLLLHFLKSIFWIRQDIGDLDRFAFEHRSPDNATPSRFKRNAESCFSMSGRAAVSRDGTIVCALLAMHRRHIGIAQPRDRFRQRIEHCLQIKSRTADDLEHIGGSGLLL